MKHNPSAGLPRPLPFLAIATSVVLVYLGASAIPIRWFERRPLRTVGFRLRASAFRDVGIGLFFGGLTPAIVVVVLLLAGAATITPVAVDWLRLSVPMILAMTLISSSEEILLRGYFMQVIGEMGGPLIASLLSGLVFGLMHAGNPGANFAGLAITAINGVLLALLAAKTGSLWLACAYHAGWNLVAAMGFGMRDSGMLSPGAFASTELHGSEFWTGGAYGFEASFLAFVVEAIVLIFLLRFARRIAYDPAAQPYYEYRKRDETPAPTASSAPA
jgi:membrane protease YdiL (CAAX protease family)